VLTPYPCDEFAKNIESKENKVEEYVPKNSPPVSNVPNHVPSGKKSILRQQLEGKPQDESVDEEPPALTPQVAIPGPSPNSDSPVKLNAKDVLEGKPNVNQIPKFIINIKSALFPLRLICDKCIFQKCLTWVRVSNGNFVKLN